MPTDREQTFGESVSTPSVERKALDLLIQASRADPKLRAAVLEVEKWINRLFESANEAWQRAEEAEADADRDIHYQADLRHKVEAERDRAVAALEQIEDITHKARYGDHAPDCNCQKCQPYADWLEETP